MVAPTGLIVAAAELALVRKSCFVVAVWAALQHLLQSPPTWLCCCPLHYLHHLSTSTTRKLCLHYLQPSPSNHLQPFTSHFLQVSLFAQVFANPNQVLTNLSIAACALAFKETVLTKPSRPAFLCDTLHASRSHLPCCRVHGLQVQPLRPWVLPAAWQNQGRTGLSLMLILLAAPPAS